MKKRIQKFLAFIKVHERNRILLAVFGLLVIAIIFIGLDNETGIILGYIATTILLIDLTHLWKRIRNFIILFLAAFFGAIFLAFLHEEIVFPLADLLGGAKAVESTPMNIFNQAVSLLILFFTPTGIFIGITGTIILTAIRIAKRRKHQFGSP